MKVTAQSFTDFGEFEVVPEVVGGDWFIDFGEFGVVEEVVGGGWFIQHSPC